MATITTNTFLDSGTARTAGETWAINGATLTIRTDTRWHAGSPASMTGSLGTMTVSPSLGGAIRIDASAVRWIPYAGGAGNVPAIGTSITQYAASGVTGYLLGVWASITSAPTAVGAAMPSTGFLKFREVTGGNFASSGAFVEIGASASGAETTGWIEVCMDQSAVFQVEPLGNGVSSIGGWFELGTISGSRGQTFQVPTNAGGSGTHVFAVQIETSAGSGVFEWFPTTTVAIGWNATSLATDVRAKFVQDVGDGLIRVGSDGTTNIGYLPPTGCKVRIPNIFHRTVATANRALNANPGSVTRSSVVLSSGGGDVKLQHFHGDLLISLSSGRDISFKDSTFEYPTISITSTQRLIEIENCAFGGYTGATGTTLLIQQSTVPCTITNTVVSSQANQTRTVSFVGMLNMVIENFRISAYKVKPATSQNAIGLERCGDSTFNGLFLHGIPLTIINCNNLTIENVDYIDRPVGTTDANRSTSAITVATSANIMVDGFTFGYQGQLDGVHCHGAVFATSTDIGAISFRNAGTRAAPISSGTNPTFYPNYVWQGTSSESNVNCQRLYFTGVRTSAFFTTPSRESLVEHVYGSFATTVQARGAGNIVRAIGGTPGNTQAGVQSGLHWADFFTSDTTGALQFLGNQPSADTLQYITLTATPKSGTGFTGTGAISLDTVGDEFIIEMPYFVKGHTAFANSAFSFTGSYQVNHTFSYQLDVGSGYSGTWKTLSGANLSAETVDPSVGFKLKLRIVVITGNSSNEVFFITIPTVSSLASQIANLYPLDTVTLSFEGLQPGSEVRAYVGSDPATSVEIGGTEAVVGSTFSFTHTSSGLDGYIAVFALGYNPLFIYRTYAYSDSTLLISQVLDRNYTNPI